MGYTKERIRPKYTENRITSSYTLLRILRRNTDNRISYPDMDLLGSPDQIARTPKQMGDALRRRRRALKMTQKDVATKAGVRQATVSDIESGERGTLRTLFDILAALDMELTARPRTKGLLDSIEDLF